jgi:N-acetylglucosaminyl-diphospho-decaprenol L-rhamnosyltransferase
VISVLIFTRDDAEWLARCLASLSCREPFEVLVFDNVSRDDTAEVVRRWRGPGGERAGRLPAGSDTSFSRGNNLLLAAAVGDLCVFLNPDTELDAGALDGAAAVLRADGGTALVGPRLRFPDGAVQPNGWALPRPGQLVAERLGLRARHVPAGSAETTPVGWLMGCFLMGRTADLRAVGGFDERYWFHATDLELCARMGRRGRIARLETHGIVHRGHTEWAPARRRATRRATAQWLLRGGGRW